MAQERTELQPIEVQAALPNFFTPTTIILGKTDELVNIITEAGYSGIQYHPIRPHALNPLGRQFSVSSINEKLRRVIVSGHQGIREERNLGEVLKTDDKIRALGVFFLMPEQLDSLQDLILLQSKLGKDLPIVSYPTRTNEEVRLTKGIFRERVFQPRPDVLEAWGIETEGVKSPVVLSQLTYEYGGRGYQGMVFDPAHWRQSGRRMLPRWEESLPYLIENGHIRELHVSVGRTDLPTQGFDTLGELKSLLNGTNDTPIMQMLGTFKQLKWRGRVVVEVYYKALSFVRTKDTDEVPSGTDMMQDHKRIVESIKGALA